MESLLPPSLGGFEDINFVVHNCYRMDKNFLIEDEAPIVSFTEISDLRLSISRIEDEIGHLRDELLEFAHQMEKLSRSFKNRL